MLNLLVRLIFNCHDDQREDTINRKASIENLMATKMKKKDYKNFLKTFIALSLTLFYVKMYFFCHLSNNLIFNSFYYHYDAKSQLLV